MPEPPPTGRVRVASTGKRAERPPRIVRIQRSGWRPEVVMSLLRRGSGRTSLPDLEPGDGLLISAEVEVTTDCERPQKDCIKGPYDYPPEVEARLVVADSKDASESKKGHARVLKTQSRKIPHLRHHDVFVFDDVEFQIPAGGLPWAGATFVNVAVGARHREAGGDHIVLIGQNEMVKKDGKETAKVVGDMGGISVVRSRPAGMPPPDVISTDRRRAESIPVVKGETRVVYAQELKDLRKREQLVVKAEVKTSAQHLDYPARATVEVILAEDPRRAEPGAEARRVTTSDGRICPRNGKNCLPAESPMTSRKVGVLRIERNAQQRLYVMAVLVTGDPRQKANKGDRLRIRDGGSLRIFRYPAEMAG
jgi:hypothetical protein